MLRKSPFFSLLNLLIISVLLVPGMSGTQTSAISAHIGMGQVPQPNWLGLGTSGITADWRSGWSSLQLGIGDSYGPDGEPQPGKTTAPMALQVATGEPGLSYRYDHTLGELRVPYLADTTHINMPFGLWADGGNVWIGESYGRRVMKFNSSGIFQSAFGDPGVGLYQNETVWWISDVAVDGSGNVWVADAEANHVLLFDAAGTRLGELGENWVWGDDNAHFGLPVSVALDSTGNLYVSDGARLWDPNEGNHRIQIFDSSGNYLNTIGQTGLAGPGNNQFYGPCHIAIYANVLYVADSGNHRVQLFNISNPAAPAYMATIGVTGQSGSDNAHLNTPLGVAVDASYIYVADTNNQRVQVFNRSTRAYVSTIGGAWGTENNQFKMPTDVAVGGGLLYVADFVNSRVQQFSSGVFQRTFGETGVPYLTNEEHYNTPYGIAVGADRSLVLVENNGHRLLKLNPDGTLAWQVGQAGMKGDWDWSDDHMNHPTDVLLDAAGRVYVADSCHSRVQIFNTDGSYTTKVNTWNNGADWLLCPMGVGMSSTGLLYVADACRNRVAVFDANLNYLASLGVVDEAGSDAAHFSSPQDVAVDSDGTIYVADSANHRIQVFDSGRNYLRTLGVTAEPGSDFGHFNWPSHVFVDGEDRLFVSDTGNQRVQIFDQDGAYLATVAGQWGSGEMQFWEPHGAALDPDGLLYVTDSQNHRVQVFTPGYPGWVQTNINGFGGVSTMLSSLDVFSGNLYAGTWEGQVWRASDGKHWNEVTPAWTDPGTYILDGEPFGARLYFGVGTSVAGEIWRTDGTTWERVVENGFGDVNNLQIELLHAFSGSLYAVTNNSSTGIEVWRSANGNPGTWTQVNADGFGGSGTASNSAIDDFGGYLYVGLSRNNVAELWRSANGTNWTAVFTDGLGPNNSGIPSMAAFNGWLYIALRNTVTGGEIWRTTNGTSWQQVVSGGLGKPQNSRPYGLIVFDGRLYLVFDNTATGAEVWRSANGTTWELVAEGGWGDPSSAMADYFDKAAAVFANRLYIGTMNWLTGSKIWKKTVTAEFSASPLTGAAPLTVQFSNSSGGDYTSCLWDFGDGKTSTAVNPSHTYLEAGVFNVTLTVSDGMDSHSRTRLAYIRTAYGIYLPLISR